MEGYDFPGINSTDSLSPNSYMELGVTVNLFSARSGRCGRRVFRHAQIIEDETGAEAEGAHHFSDRLSGFLEGFKDADGEAAQSGEIFRAEAGADATAVLMKFQSMR